MHPWAQGTGTYLALTPAGTFYDTCRHLPDLRVYVSWRRTCFVMFDDPTDEDSSTRNLSCARFALQ